MSGDDTSTAHDVDPTEGDTTLGRGRPERGEDSVYDTENTSDGYSGSSDDDDVRDIPAMQTAIADALAPVREQVLRVAAERRQVIVRDIEAFFATQQTDGAVDAFEGNVHALVAAAGADLVAVSQNMISMRPVVALEIRRMAEGARAEYQQRKATRAQADTNAE